MSVSQSLKKAIKASELSLYRISLEAGVDQAVLRRFVNNDADVRASTIDKLTEYLDLELVLKKRKSKQR